MFMPMFLRCFAIFLGLLVMLGCSSSQKNSASATKDDVFSPPSVGNNNNTTVTLPNGNSFNCATNCYQLYSANYEENQSLNATNLEQCLEQEHGYCPISASCNPSGTPSCARTYGQDPWMYNHCLQCMNDTQTTPQSLDPNTFFCGIDCNKAFTYMGPGGPTSDNNAISQCQAYVTQNNCQTGTNVQTNTNQAVQPQQTNTDVAGNNGTDSQTSSNSLNPNSFPCTPATYCSDTYGSTSGTSDMTMYASCAQYQMANCN